ncbi:FG-GAP repeat domain-containing protein [Maribacter sp. 2307ULW6-5]|uniref:FG-GAP repeat domain-containing protein n=1 Tax=Maribacter sp. 2307ULW6-5 TaxID=3386275 RepID=UPI0039BD75D4
MKHYPFTVFFLATMLFSCTPAKEKRAIALYEAQCASCHLAPKVNELPKHLWKEAVLPEMAARMGLITKDNNPYHGLSFEEQGARMATGVFPERPLISVNDWNTLQEYIIALAPDSLPKAIRPTVPKSLTQFSAKTVDVYEGKGASLSFLEYDQQQQELVLANLKGAIKTYGGATGQVTDVDRTGRAVTSFISKNQMQYTTEVGFLNPSERPRGALHIRTDSQAVSLPFVLHRPVHTLVEDLNADGNDEIVVCEFGHLTGALSLFVKKNGLTYERRTLLDLPGTVRSMARDMNGDNKLDLIVMTTQGREGITIFHQGEDLQFSPETVLQFSPIYGSSWFDLVDYNKDGLLDIITAHGDNADKSYVQKPYHGIRIHINQGQNVFQEQYFYPLNGATRFVAKDFDQDGDVDLALLATFPDYENRPNASFTYLENLDSEAYQFQDFVTEHAKEGRWLLMDSGDVDQDGDQDIVLSSFTYGFTPVPEDLANLWNQSSTDLLLLENLLK